MPPSRKRAKGKERKAKAMTQRALKVREHWTSVLCLGEENNAPCTHGCDTIPPEGHLVSNFMNEFTSFGTSLLTDVFSCMDVLFRNHPLVWSDDNNRNMALRILIRMGANFLLHKTSNSARPFAYAASMLENYDGNIKFDMVKIRSASIVERLSGGYDRDTFSFYNKRVDCSCLKQKYKASKSHPKVGVCSGCRNLFERKLLMVCSACRVSQYCSEMCHVNSWPVHGGRCKIVVEAKKMAESE